MTQTRKTIYCFLTKMLNKKGKQEFKAWFYRTMSGKNPYFLPSSNEANIYNDFFKTV